VLEVGGEGQDVEVAATLLLAELVAGDLDEVELDGLVEVVDRVVLAGDFAPGLLVVALEDGSVKVDDDPFGFGTVNYLIFELGDGDVRSYLSIAGKFDVAWTLRCLHHVATGLHQLHSSGVAHQDLKPSNVLVFEGVLSKVADLGCASIKGMECPRDGRRIAGDRTYAPPELLYGYQDGEWSRRRQACDLYHLGSLATFFFCGLGMTAMIFKQLSPSHHPRVWGGTYHEVLPEVRDSFGLALLELEKSISVPALRKPVCGAVGQLCDPDPYLRGHPRNRVGFANRYSLERYVALFDLMAQRAGIAILN